MVIGFVLSMESSNEISLIGEVFRRAGKMIKAAPPLCEAVFQRPNGFGIAILAAPRARPLPATAFFVRGRARRRKEGPVRRRATDGSLRWLVVT